jgi:REP element-mobilizing transposase RayT
MNALAEEDVEQRLGLPMLMVGKLAMFKLDRLSVYGYLRHPLIIRVLRYLRSPTVLLTEPRPRGSAERTPLFSALYLVTYFVTFVCYGTWLHGDECGSVDPRHNVPGHRLVEPNGARVCSEQSRMQQEAYEMDEPRRACVLGAVLQHCEYRCWPLLAAHVRTNHVHVIVDAPLSPEKVLNELKAYASRRLNQIGLDTPDRRRWARHGSTRYLWNRDDVGAAIQYVADLQGDSMAVYVNRGSW